MGAVEKAVEAIAEAAVERFIHNHLEECQEHLTFTRNECFENNEEFDFEFELELFVERTLKASESEMYEAMHEQMDCETTYYYQGIEIINDYGFTESLKAANNACFNLDSTNECQIAYFVLSENLPSMESIEEMILYEIKCKLKKEDN